MMRRRISWLLLNGGMTTCAIYGLFYGVEGAKNILLFGVWTLAVLNSLAAGNEKVRADVRKKGRPIPAWLAVTTDLFIVVALASVGRFFSATAMFWQMLCELAIFNEDAEKKAGTP